MNELDHRIRGAAISLIAENGIRGAAFRKIGERAGVHFSKISKIYDSKNSLLVECFVETVRRDLARVRQMVDSCLNLRLNDDAVLHFLWMNCDDYGSDFRLDGIVLAELLLASESNEHFADVCKEWLTARRNALRELSAHLGVEDGVMDVISLILLSELMYSVACHQSVEYRLASRYGLVAAYSSLTNQGKKFDVEDQRGLFEQFYLNLPPIENSLPSLPRGDEEGTRKRIIGAAASIIENRGVHDVTNRAVAELSDVSPSLTQYYFKNIVDLQNAGISHIFERTRELAATRAKELDILYGETSVRVVPEEIRREYQLVYRGMVEVVLAAARDEERQRLAVLMRRQTGYITFLGLGPRGQNISKRLAAAVYSLWAMPTLILVPLFAERKEGWDFEAQSRLTRARLLGASDETRAPPA